MIFRNVKSLTEFRPGMLSQFEDFEHTNFVRRRLSGHDDIAFNRLDAVAFRVRCVGHQIVDGLFARPLLVVDASIDDQTGCPPEFHGETTKV